MGDLFCYFGCPGRLNRTLLDLPDLPAPKLCESHSEEWGIYRAELIAKSNTIDWPADFWPFERKMQEQMEKEVQTVQAGETRSPGTEISASEAIAGAWYTVPSDEIERCVASRNRGRGVQVGFVGLLDVGTDPEEIRWLQGKTLIVVADEIEVAKLVRALREDGKIKLPSMADDFPFELCPRNGLLCSACECPQRETPNGATCENGHGDALGKWKAGEIDTTAAQVVSTFTVAEVENVRDALSELDVRLSLPAEESLARTEADLTGLAAREAGATGAYTQEMTEEFYEERARIQSEIDAAPKPFTLPVYHKSLHTDWRTPKPLFDSQVRRWGPFWLDAAATAENKLCEYHLGPGAEVEDALTVDWLPTPEIVAAYGSNVWLNHPYSKREPACAPDCAKPKCAERGYHLEKPIMSSGDWMIYARDQVLLKGAPRLVCLTKAAVETGWWRDAVRRQPLEAGKFLQGICDPAGGPAAQYMDERYPAATWLEFIWENLIVDIVEIEGRVDFDRGGDDGSAGFPSAIVTFYRP